MTHLMAPKRPGGVCPQPPAWWRLRVPGPHVLLHRVGGRRPGCFGHHCYITGFAELERKKAGNLPTWENKRELVSYYLAEGVSSVPTYRPLAFRPCGREVSQLLALGVGRAESVSWPPAPCPGLRPCRAGQNQGGWWEAAGRPAPGSSMAPPMRMPTPSCPQ